MPYCEPWRDSRRMAHHEFSATAVKRFRASEAKATRHFLRNMHRHPAKMMDNLRQYVTPLPRASLSLVLVRFPASVSVSVSTSVSTSTFALILVLILILILALALEFAFAFAKRS